MHPRHYTLSERLGTERPFAYVPRSVALAGSPVPDGAVVLYATIAALGDDEGGASASPAELRGYTGMTPRTINRWVKALARIDGVTLYEGGGYRTIFDLGLDRRGLMESRKFARVPLLHWEACDKWTVPMRRLWIAIWAYCGRGRGCYVGVDRLALDCGRKHRATQANLTLLSNAELLRIEYKRRATSDLLPFDGERFMEPKDRKARKQTAHQGLSSRTQTAHQGGEVGHKLHPSRTRTARKSDTERQPSRTQTAPYLELEQESNRKGEHAVARAQRRQVRDKAIAAERTGPMIWKDGTVDVQATIEARKKSA